MCVLLHTGTVICDLLPCTVNICTLAMLFVADVIRDELFAGVQHTIFFQVICLRQSCM